jgi:DNA-binding NarL/FixJ family response regulator
LLRIGIRSTSPLIAGGLLAALSGVADWQPSTDPAVDGDALVLHTQGGADALARHAALPPRLPAVLLGEDLREIAQRSAADPRPLALLASSATPARLRAALGAVLQGLSVRDAAEGFARGAPAWETEPLTPRELEVFELLGKGLSNRDIAGVLGISAHTAKFHVGQILAKVGAATRAEAVSCGLRLGLIGL